MKKQNQLDWLQLYRSENVGPVTFANLLKRFGTAKEALNAIPEIVRRAGGKRSPKLCPRSVAEQEMAAVESFGARLLCGFEDEFPTLLGHIGDSPPVLAVKGHLSLLSRDSIGIVGARNASQNARRFTQYMSKELGGRGYVVTSGVARGIDTAAHAAALDTGTIGVIAGGIDTVYPKENAGLQTSIVERGLLIAEAPFGAQPIARNFPKRNRIIAGLSKGVLVVEAALKSGSLITARLANEYGREVFAVPGFPTDPRGAGCNQLIKNGAALVETPQDLISALELLRQNLQEPASDLFEFAYKSTKSGADFDEKQIEIARAELKNLIGPASITVDELVSECQFSASLIQAALTELELVGHIERLPGNRVAQILSNFNEPR
ncbi:MAG: DNA-processing protein DprA [Alphaproteobacteria bacterium]